MTHGFMVTVKGDNVTYLTTITCYINLIFDNGFLLCN